MQLFTYVVALRNAVGLSQAKKFPKRPQGYKKHSMPSKFKHEPLCGKGISAILIFLDILVTRYNLITLVPIELEQKFRQILKALVKSINLKYSKGSKGS